MLLNWRTVHFVRKRALATALLVGVVILALNFHIFFTFGQISNVNGTQIVRCYATDDNPSSQIMNTWPIAHSFLYSYIPFGILTVTNVLLIAFTNRKRPVSNSSNQSSGKKSTMNITVMGLTILFIATTFPGTIVTSK